MGFTQQEKSNLNSKVLQADVMDAVSSAVWFEGRLFAGKVIDARQTWADFATLETLPAANLLAAQANALANPTLVSDLSLAASAVRLTEAVASNSSTYVALTTFGDFTSPRLNNWIQPQQIPQASGFPSNGYAVRLFDGDPATVGVEVFTTDGQTGTGINKSSGWVWNYSNGILLISDDFYTQTGINPSTFDPYVLGFRYIGPTAGGASTSDAVIQDVTQAAHGFTVGEAIYWDGAAWQLAQSNAQATLATHLVYAVAGANDFTTIQSGYMTGFVGLTPGDYYFVDDATPGALVNIDPTIAQPLSFSNPVLVAETATTGWVLPWRAYGPGTLTGGILTTLTTTVSAVSVQAQTITMPTDGYVYLRTEVICGEQAPNTDGASYVRTVRVNIVAGVPTLHTLQTDYTSEDDASWDVTFVTSAPNVAVEITGDATNPVDWRVVTTVIAL